MAASHLIEMRASVKEPRQLLDLASKPQAAYESVPLTSLVAYCMYWLKRWDIRQSIEAIAVCAWRLFPLKFAMIGFPDFPDAFRVNRSLLQGQPKYRNFLTGSAKDGFSLNARGVELAEQLGETIGPPSWTGDDNNATTAPTPQPRPDAKITGRSIEPAAELLTIRASKLFGKWKSGILAQRDLIHLHSMLGVFDHTPAKVRTRKYRALLSSATILGDSEILEFLHDVSNEFPTYVK